MSDFDAISGAIRLIKCTVEGEAADANSNVPTGLTVTFNCNSQISNLEKFKEGFFLFCKNKELKYISITKTSRPHKTEKNGPSLLPHLILYKMYLSRLKLYLF